MNLRAPVDVQTPESFEQHRTLLHLFARGDLATFEALMTTHILASGQRCAPALALAGRAADPAIPCYHRHATDHREP